MLYTTIIHYTIIYTRHIQDDSDEEAEPQQPRKKRRWRRRNDGPKRQWVLQEEADYLETMIAQREQGANYKLNVANISTRYEGLPEHNPSHYVLMSVAEGNGNNNIKVTTLPTPA